MLGNATYGAAKTLVAMGQGVQRLIDPPAFLHSLDRLVASATNAFRSTIFVIWLPVSLLLLGVLIATRAWRQDLPHALRDAAWALLVLGLATYAADYPVRASQAADSMLASTLGTIDQTFSPGQGSPTAATGTLEVDGVLYPFWLDGELGSSTTQTAKHYGPKLFADQSLDWGQPVTDAETSAKEQAFANDAGALKSADPTAYHQLTGENGGRTGAGIMALIAALITVSFKLVAGFLVIASLLILRLVVILLPALAVIGLHERTSMVVKGTLVAGGAALLNAVIFSAGAGVSVFATSVLLSPSAGLPQWVGLLLSAVVAYLLWHLLRPFRRLTQMVGGAFSPVHAMADGMGHAREGAGRWSRRAVAAMAGGTTAVAAEMATEPPSSEATTTSGGPAPPSTSPEAWSRGDWPPALDVPSWPMPASGAAGEPAQPPLALPPAAADADPVVEPPPEPSASEAIEAQLGPEAPPMQVVPAPSLWFDDELEPASLGPPEEAPEPALPVLDPEPAALPPVEERAVG
ncbi:MAG: hypothetical protein J2P59_01625 [Acidimicrobiales bacterium]|nr:hypothetical protein [Acidimicrobiales bacterium]